MVEKKMLVSREKSRKLYGMNEGEEKKNEQEEENLVQLFNPNEFDETSSPSRYNSINMESADDGDRYFEDIVRLKKATKSPSISITRDSSSVLSPSVSMTLKPSVSRFQNAEEVKVKIDGSIDWYGNTCLHHLFALREIDPAVVEKAIKEFPSCISHQNQFGRLPIHYAIDRGQVNTKALEILLQYYPQSVQMKDSEGNTPYDLARKWEHPNPILLSLLSKHPDLDKGMYMKLKYGPIGSLAHWATNSFRSVLANDDNNAVPQQDDDIDNTSYDDTVTGRISFSNSASQHNVLIENTVFAPAITRSQSRRFSLDSLHSLNMDYSNHDT